jgi:hypothetical protein
LWFHLDFLAAPVDPSALEIFAWQGILDQLRSRYRDKNLETRRNIKRAFEDKIQLVSQTMRSFMMPAGTFEKEISPYLEKWQSDVLDYVPRLLRTTTTNRGSTAVIFIDNVDQLSPAYQAQIFVLAERITRIVGSLTVLALREESYYTASIQKTLTAYTSRKFHIASPRFRRLIDKPGTRPQIGKQNPISVNLQSMKTSLSRLGALLVVTNSWAAENVTGGGHDGDDERVGTLDLALSHQVYDG